MTTTNPSEQIDRLAKAKLASDPTVATIEQARVAVREERPDLRDAERTSGRPTKVTKAPLTIAEAYRLHRDGEGERLAVPGDFTEPVDVEAMRRNARRWFDSTQEGQVLKQLARAHGQRRFDPTELAKRLPKHAAAINVLKRSPHLHG